MSDNNRPDCTAPPIAIPPTISRLSLREADRMLAALERSRLAEIDNYWALCHAEPDSAARVAAGAAPIVKDVLHLARNTLAAPHPDAILSLANATARLLRVPAIRASLLDDMCEPGPADPADTFWEDGRIVALKHVGEQRILVLRYDGPLFNPGTVPEASVIAADDCYLVCRRGGVSAEENYECLTAYVTGGMDARGNWQALPIDLASRNELMRDLQSMETLVDGGRLSDAPFDAKPLPTFPGSSDRSVEQVQTHKATLRRAGAITSEQQAMAERRARPLYARMTQLHQRVERIADELHDIRRQIVDAEACALEEATGFARGERVRHRSTGDEGTLEIVHFGTAQSDYVVQVLTPVLTLPRKFGSVNGKR